MVAILSVFVPLQLGVRYVSSERGTSRDGLYIGLQFITLLGSRLILAEIMAVLCMRKL
jgi:hypothetical protein